ncbi:MAG: glycosyltransferase family 4 protein, partial [Flavobacteriaceae bacterium]|nr:glycosyltransferase family 4 protein [Flavobacteriaceae bacterium]
MPKIYIITSYYPPEIGAASNRIYHLAQGLKARGFQVNVIAPLPNYPTGEIFEKYKGKLYLHEIMEGISIRRLWLYPTNSSNKAIRLFSMLSYSISLMVFYLFHPVSKRVIVQCPPLLVAFTSMFFLRRKRRTLVLNVSDLWPSIGIELGALKEGFFVKVLRKIEKFNYKKADIILGQSNEILTHVENLFPNKKLMLYRNFPIVDDLVPEKIIARDKAVKVVYAGLLGEAQGILDLCKKWNNEVELHLYGEGSERDKIEDYLKNAGSS